MANFRNSLKRISPSWIRQVYRRIYRARSSPSLGWVLSNLAFTPHTVFDIGANIGDTVNTFLEFFPTATVYGFEPSAATFQKLQENVGDKGQRAHLHQLGFSSSNQTALLNITSFHGANSLVDMNPDYSDIHPQIQTLRHEAVRLTTLDEFVREHKIEHIDLVKIDVEGFERQVLLGGAETFKSQVDMVLMELSFVRHGLGSDEWLQAVNLMHTYGFDLIALYDLSYSRWANHGRRLEQMDAVFGKQNKLLLK
ncbi:MAG: FkbM family methyltransferase [Caldilineaceae bacterium]|nr:FkbM family methyltransferase [Caldilineaceae bacterium]